MGGRAGTDPRERLQRVLRVAYSAVPEGEPAAAQVRAGSGRRWATRRRTAARVALLVLVVAVLGAVALWLVAATRPPPVAQPVLPEPGVTAPSVRAPSPPTSAEPTSTTGGAPPPSAGAGGSDPGELGTLLVHVTGAVHAPGLVTVPAGARVNDALHAAGGATADADLAAVNLADWVVDGQQVRVPRVGEGAPPPPSAPGAGGGGAGGSEGVGPVNLNTADAAALETLPGIGPALAQRILAWRDEHGPFTSVEQLDAVSGIGSATMERLRDLVTT